MRTKNIEISIDIAELAKMAKDIEKYNDAELQFFFSVLAMSYTDTPHIAANAIIEFIRERQSSTKGN
jgi:hypothetical protein